METDIYKLQLENERMKAIINRLRDPKNKSFENKYYTLKNEFKKLEKRYQSVVDRFVRLGYRI